MLTSTQLPLLTSHRTESWLVMQNIERPSGEFPKSQPNTIWHEENIPFQKILAETGAIPISKQWFYELKSEVLNKAKL